MIFLTGQRFPFFGFDVSFVALEEATLKAINTVIISWPDSATGFVLESSGTVDTGYTAVTEPVVPNGNQNTVTISITGDAQFFRLKNPAP